MKKKVEVLLYASFQKYLPQVGEGYVLEEPKTIGEILVDLGIPEEHVMVIMIGDRLGRPDSMLEGGERLKLFPLIGGG